MVKERSLLSGILLTALLSCGLPQTTLLDPPVVGSSSLTSLSFIPVAGVERYVLMYKFYWPGESTISTDRNVFSGDSLLPGVNTPQNLGFIQMKKTAGTGGSYPADSGEITLTGVTGTVLLDFSAVSSTIQITGANETVLYRRVIEQKRGEPQPINPIVTGKTFFNRNYDFLGLDPFSDGLGGDDVVDGGGYSTDLNGLDGDIFRLFNNPPAGSYVNLAEDGSLIVAVVVYSNSYDVTNGGAINSIPVYLGTVEISNIDWKS